MTLRPLLLAAVAALALAACDKTAKGKVAAAVPGETAEAAKEAEKKPLDEELLDKLTATTSPEEAALMEEEVWDAWLLSGSPTVDIAMKRGVEAQEAGDIELARDMYDRAIMLKPEYAEGWNRRALIFFNEAKYDEAISDLEAALTYEPRHFGAWIGLGMIFESVEAPEAALQAYRNALAVHPHAEAAKQGEKRLIVQVEGRQL
jgi:tetratricopeptide (TPR) repeat protein